MSIYSILTSALEFSVLIDISKYIYITDQGCRSRNIIIHITKHTNWNMYLFNDAFYVIWHVLLFGIVTLECVLWLFPFNTVSASLGKPIFGISSLLDIFHSQIVSSRYRKTSIQCVLITNKYNDNLKIIEVFFMKWNYRYIKT